MAIWSSGCGRIELEIDLAIASIGYHPGDCSYDIEYIRFIPEIKKQLMALDSVLLANVLREYGGWDDIELKQHDKNLGRILWLACADLID